MPQKAGNTLPHLKGGNNESDVRHGTARGHKVVGVEDSGKNMGYLTGCAQISNGERHV